MSILKHNQWSDSMIFLRGRLSSLTPMYQMHPLQGELGGWVVYIAKSGWVQCPPTTKVLGRAYAPLPTQLHTTPTPRIRIAEGNFLSCVQQSHPH